MMLAQDLLVFAILVPLFAFIAIWLLVYARKRSALIRRYATARGLIWRQADDGTLERQLDDAFRLEDRALARAFSRVRDIVADDGLLLFRVTELLDLNPHGSSQNSHFGRIAVLFDAPAGPFLFFNAVNRTQNLNLYPASGDLEANRFFEALGPLLATNPPRHTLSITVMRGKALMYLQRLTGTENETDLEYLCALARDARTAFAGELLDSSQPALIASR
ncbi:MAG: hypothetical protein ACYS0G_08725 [Planctomycetota bacterium]|jgi:hypothetical protein